MTGLKWTRRSSYTVSAALAAEGLAACPNTVAAALKELGFSLKRQRKEIGETQHPQRNAQFEQIAATKAEFQDRGQPVISVDSKKRELVGRFLKAGPSWCRETEQVFTHDFRTLAKGIALPYGIYDGVANTGTVVVGTSRDTAEFAVDAIETWLTSYGWYHYPDMSELLILCDAGGSNSCRTHLWKYALSQRLVQQHGIAVTVCHYPPGASKWNPIDHRLFSQISLNWAGVSLQSYQLILNRIRTVRTKTGLTVDATLNRKRYDTGIKVPPEEFHQIKLTPISPLPQWNYTIVPQV
jgi:hypothetical protein